MPSTTTALITGVVSLVVAVVALAGTLLVERSRRRGAVEQSDRAESQQRELERLRDRQQRELAVLEHELEAARADADQARQADELMATYLNPLARSTQDLQSRLWNMHRGFRGSRDLEYYRANTMYIVAEVLGWLEIIRQEVQFLDAGARTEEVRRATAELRDRLASTSRNYHGDVFYLYRGQQRAIGELMIVPRETSAGRPGPSRQCLGYAAFVARLDEPEFARWFERLGAALDGLASTLPRRLVDLQHAAVDLLDVLDPDRSRSPEPRSKIDRAI